MSRLQVLCFRLFAVAQARIFRAIDLPKQAVFFDNDRTPTPGIGSLSMPNIMEIYKYADSKASADLTY